MIIQDILKTRAGKPVVCVAPSARVSEACLALAQNRIGAVVVSRDGVEPLGILSERDIVRAVAAAGPGCFAAPVSDLMTRQLVTCARRDEVLDVLQKMTDGRFRHMPVVEEGRMLGIVTLGDLVKARLDELHAETDALQGMIMGR